MNRNQIHLSLAALLHFDGTTMTIQIQSLRDPTGASLNDTTGTAARIFEFFRAKGIETQDYRVIDQPRPQVIPYDAPPVTAKLAPRVIEGEDILNSEGDEAVLIHPDGTIASAPSAGPRPVPIFPEPIGSHHVKLDMDDAKQTKKLLETDEFRKPREEISL